MPTDSIIKQLSDYMILINNIYNMDSDKNNTFILEKMKDKESFFQTLVLNFIHMTFDKISSDYLNNNKNDKILKNKNLSKDKRIKLYIAKYITHILTKNKHIILPKISPIHSIQLTPNIILLCRQYTDIVYKYITNYDIDNGIDLYLHIISNISKILSIYIIHQCNTFLTKEHKKNILSNIFDNILNEIRIVYNYEGIIDNIDSDSDSESDSNESSEINLNGKRNLESDSNDKDETKKLKSNNKK